MSSHYFMELFICILYGASVFLSTDLAMSADHPHSSNYEVSPQTLSLTIRNTSQADAGTYICYVITNDGEEIMAEYSVAVIGKSVERGKRRGAGGQLSVRVLTRRR